MAEAKQKPLLLIPAYNEEETLGKVIEDIRALWNDELDLLVVDDGSQDTTFERAKACGVKVLRLPFNLGYGSALQTGYKYALRHGYEWLVQMDADGQHDPYFIKSLLKEVQEGRAEVAIGSRFLLPQEGYQVPFFRRVAIGLFALLDSLILGQKVTDPTSGFQAMNRKALEFCSSPFYPWDYPDADHRLMLSYSGLRVKEVPVLMRQSPRGKSMHHGLHVLYYLFKMPLSMLMTLMRKKALKEALLKK